MTNYIKTPIRISLVVLTLISGCSDSGNTVPANDINSDVVPGAMADEITSNSTVENETQGENTSDNGLSGGDTTVNEATVNGANANDATISDNTVNDTTENDKEPTIDTPPQSTQVNIDITVPFYLSNQLQVKLVSGDIDATAMWVEKVSWRIVENFPANAENPVAITFYDENGGIALASVNTNFKTGVGDEHTFEITADQWDIDRWDTDSDGVSNLMELAQGGNPRSANNAAQPLADNFVHAFSFIPSIQSGFYNFESDIPELGEPVNIDEDTFVGGEFGSTTTTRDITLSADGNGTYSDTWFNFIYGDVDGIRNWNGTRSSQGNTVSWSGRVGVQIASSIAYRTIDENFEVSSTISGRELKQVATSTISYPRFSNPGSLVHSYDIVLDLDSMDADGKCAVLRGTLTQTRDFLQMQVYTANRSTSDARWEWEINTDENVVSGESSAIKNRFYCDFQFQQSTLNKSNDQFSIAPEIERASSLYESELLTHRIPANVQNETLVQSSESQSLASTRNVDISAEGNGTFSGLYSDDFAWVPTASGDIEINSSGTRSSQENTVSWSGTEAVTGRRSSRSYDETVFEISNTINGSELMQTGSGSIAYREGGVPYHSFQYDIVLDLRSINSEKTCSVLRGQLSFTADTTTLNENSDSFGLLNQETASRSSSDEQWAWSKTADGETQSGLATVLGNRFHCEYLFNERF